MAEDKFDEFNVFNVEDVETQELENVWTVGRKFLISISVVVFLLITTAIVSIYYLNRIVKTNDEIVNHTLVVKQIALEITGNLNRHKAILASYINTKETGLKTEAADIRSRLVELNNQLKLNSITEEERKISNNVSEKLNYALSLGSDVMNAESSESTASTQSTNNSVKPEKADINEIQKIEFEEVDLGIDEIDLGLGDIDLGLNDVDLGLSETTVPAQSKEKDEEKIDLGYDINNEAFAGSDGNASSGASSMQEYNLAVFEFIEVINVEIIERMTTISERQKKSVEEDIFWGKAFILFLIFILVAFNVGQYFYFNRSITEPIKSLRRYLLSMGRGELPEFKMKVWKDDIGEMVKAVRNLLLGLKQTAKFAIELGGGNLEAEYSPLSKNDVLGNSLMNMRDSLRRVADEDEKRNWANSGVADFAEILRKNNDNLEKLTDQIIMYLVNYIKVNQGGIFLVNDLNRNDIHLELASIYAWDRKKFVEARIEMGQGLVGQCWYEQKTIFMTEVPDSFIRITSGLGEATPRCILIVPLISNEEIYGVLELASFKVLETYEIDFVEKVAETIASAVGNVRITERTKILLEEAQQQGEELRANEEEMRQNMEEMNATQEEMDRIIQEKDNQIEELKRELKKLKG